MSESLSATVGQLPPLDEKLYRTRRRRRAFLDDLTSFWFLLPILAVFVVLTLVPMVQTVYFSLTDFNGYNLDAINWVGLSNYQRALTDSSTVQALGFTVLYAVVVTLGVTVLAIPLAVVLNKKFVGCNFVRSLFFFLGVPSMAILGMVWQYIFSPLDSGVVNSVLNAMGIESVSWLSASGLARFCVIFVGIWAQVGWHATLYLAFLQSIPGDLYEQATVDGANGWQKFVHITLPQLTPGIVTSTFLLMNGGLKVYDLPYTLTGGGPGYSTYTVTQTIIQQGIGQSEYGLGSALAVLFFIATALVTMLQLGISNLVQRRFT